MDSPCARCERTLRLYRLRQRGLYAACNRPRGQRCNEGPDCGLLQCSAGRAAGGAFRQGRHHRSDQSECDGNGLVRQRFHAETVFPRRGKLAGLSCRRRGHGSQWDRLVPGRELGGILRSRQLQGGKHRQGCARSASGGSRYHRSDQSGCDRYRGLQRGQCGMRIQPRRQELAELHGGRRNHHYQRDGIFPRNGCGRQHFRGDFPCGGQYRQDPAGSAGGCCGHYRTDR